MKYEITKGSEKDFEGAPEWATKLLGETSASRQVFSGYHGGLMLGAYKENPRYWWKLNERNTATIIAERRPITEQVVNQQLTTEWDGEGLPPVGVRCEHLGGGENDWMVVTVIAISESPDGYFTDCWLRTDKGANFIIGNPYRFRPIRSPEDVAREKITLNMLQYMYSSDETDHAQVCKIYDAIAAGKIPGIKLES